MKQSFVRRGILGLVFALLTAAADAQGVLRVGSDSPTPGSTLSIDYTNPCKAGQRIDVKISDGAGTTVTVVIQLDAAGHGMGAWLVPAWMFAIFNAPDADEVTVCIGGGDDAL